MWLKGMFQLCFLRAAPQDLPASPIVLLFVLVAYAATDILLVLPVLTPGSAVVAAMVDTLLLTAMAHLVLHWRGLEQRVIQTLTALAGCGAMLSLLAWSAAALVPDELPRGPIWAAFLVWVALVFGHVLRHALSISFAAGVGASLLYLILSMSVTGLFMQPAPVTN